MVHRAPTVGLAVVVKNGARFIERCLRSSLPIIDYVLVVDTGSTDGTPDIVERFLASHGMPGRVHDQKWRNIANARSIALALLRAVESIDYALMVDVTDELSFEGDVASVAQSLNAHVCYPATISDATTCLRSAFISNRKAFYYKGVVQEVLACDDGQFSVQIVQGLCVKADSDGLRERRPERLRKEADLLLSAIARETDPRMTRHYTYCLGQTLKTHAEAVSDPASLRQAQRWFRQRSRMMGDDVEVYFSLLMAAICGDRLDDPHEEVIAEFERAIAFIPGRAEAPFEASRHCVRIGDHALAYELARLATMAARPSRFERHFPWIYDWGALEQCAATSFMTGKAADAIELCERLLDSAPNLPDHERERIAGNRDFAVASLNESARHPQ